jgi:hypothetical protein
MERDFVFSFAVSKIENPFFFFFFLFLFYFKHCFFIRLACIFYFFIFLGDVQIQILFSLIEIHVIGTKKILPSFLLLLIESINIWQSKFILYFN